MDPAGDHLRDRDRGGGVERGVKRGVERGVEGRIGGGGIGGGIARAGILDVTKVEAEHAIAP